MLIEIRSDKFRTKHIRFHKGLNVILGDKNATNSIGKSTLLMIIDFAYGGSSLLRHNEDLIKELGHHNYFFTFKFGEDFLRFQRGTEQPDLIYRCNEEYEPSTSPITLEGYAALLKAAYNIAIEDISFRALVGLYLRVWGKDNLNVHKPLHVVQTQTGKDCVHNLIKTFGLYDSIKELTRDLTEKEDEHTALKSAFRNRIVPKIGKRQHKENEKRIAQIEQEISEIKTNLAKYATNISEVVNQEVLELKVQKDELLSLKLQLESKAARIRKNISENRHIKSRHFDGLMKFFPDINKERLASIEEFHNGVAKLLGAELREAEKELQRQLEQFQREISTIDTKMSKTLASVDKPEQIVDRVVELANSFHGAKNENTYFENEVALNADIGEKQKSLSEEKVKVIEKIQNTLNDEIQKIVQSVFGPNHKSPAIRLKENNYSYEVFEDTGTGTAYASLVVLDLAIFKATTLPIIAHDSLLFKNIENDSVAYLFKVYMSIEKQSFVAIDEIEKYGPEIEAILRNQSVIQLDNNNVLYIKDWRS